MEHRKIHNFTDLNAWRETHKLAVTIYGVVNKFPKHERYALSDQMWRCAISVSSNIAEGFSRPTKPDKSHFYSIAKGSLTELQNQLILARDVGYLKEKDFERIFEQTRIASKLLTGLWRYVQ